MDRRRAPNPGRSSTYRRRKSVQTTGATADLQSLRRIIDFDTEVCMNSILGFLENSTGFYLADTIAAMEAIGARGTAATLRTIQQVMAEHRVTHERLRGDLARMQEWQISTFAECHGEELSQMADLVGRESKKLYIYDRMHDREGEDVFVLLSSIYRATQGRTCGFVGGLPCKRRVGLKSKPAARSATLATMPALQLTGASGRPAPKFCALLLS
jgi:hypothetical protein